jgi:NAD(P)-dependent dehydrogenase (short-subunit alcohol dehydrogenase family)
MGELEGRVALVTGGAASIGRAIVEAFVREGAAVAIADVDGPSAETLVADLAASGGRGMAVVGDVSRAEDARAMVAACVEGLGRLDVLVNNAGIQPVDWYFRVEDTPEEVWDRILGVNLKGTFLMCKYALPAIRASGGGAVVNIASVQGLQSMPGVPSYAASKGGMLSLTRNLALDYAADRIRVNAVCPGTIDSGMVRRAALAEGGDIEANVRRYGAIHPLGRIGQPSEIAEAVLFLAGDRASFITGEYLCVDGGFMARGAWAGGVGADP